ncbi:protein disulfide-isomerase precursor [Lunasporangiospora selenospora]|uniref:Protein disulfide-isomerase n=1 Tax=Lunasporangiospora selenospora TaxID=979761 RepID=A0A9P6KED0_9FUNG|nr:protein disulfide-isomerase precursor [Lunasporangiospora selenospora]
MRLSAAVALVSLAATSMLAGVRAETTESATSDVLVLGEKNFKDVVNPEDLILVEFYAPWCGHCKALAPEYEIAATELKESKIPIAKVDCTVEADLCQEHGVQGYPTLKVFRSGVASEYKGERKANGIVSYLKKQALPALSVVSAEDLAKFSASDKVVIVGVLPKDSPLRAELEKFASEKRDEYTFGVVEESTDLKGSGIVLYKKFDEGKNVLEGDFTKESLLEFINTHSTPIMDDIGPNNYATYMESGLPLAYFFYDKGPKLEALAKEFKGKVNFVYIDAGKFGAHAANLNLKDSWPAFGVQNVVSGAKYPLSQEGDFAVDGVKGLVEGIIDGSIAPSVKSEAIPETNDGPVKVVVAHTYKEIVEDKEKDVLIEFYAPWCGHCKNLAPIYDELGALYKDSKIVVAKFDATANDLPEGTPFQVQGFPTIKFRKAGSDEYIDYEGERTTEAFVKFLDENSVNKVPVTLPVKAEEPKAADEKPVAAEDIEHDEL